MGPTSAVRMYYRYMNYMCNTSNYHTYMYHTCNTHVVHFLVYCITVHCSLKGNVIDCCNWTRNVINTFDLSLNCDIIQIKVVYDPKKSTFQNTIVFFMCKIRGLATTDIVCLHPTNLFEYSFEHLLHHFPLTIRFCAFLLFHIPTPYKHLQLAFPEIFLTPF